VASIAVDVPWQTFRDELHAKYEDGTVNFLDIIALQHAIREHRRLFGSQEAISRHTHTLFHYLYQRMAGLRHANGQPVCQLYVDPKRGLDVEHQGPTLAFNLWRPDGRPVGYVEVERIANVHRIHIRTGGFCNPGAAQRWLELDSKDLLRHKEASIHVKSIT
jgi:molybdenum cofactor sulfurtransferase